MNSGKVSNSILKRSVLKLIKKSSEEVLCGPGLGVDCGVIKGRERSNVVLAISDAQYGVYRVTNNLAAVGAESVAIMSNIIMPEAFDEKELKTLITKMQKECSELKIQIAGVHTAVSNEVTKAIVSVTGMGYSQMDNSISSKNVKPNQDIIMTKWIGIEGTRIISELKRDEILKVYTDSFLEKAVGDISEMSVIKEAKIAAENGITAMHTVSEGGIFGALWDMAEAGKVGLDVDFKKISVKQEIIEVCELFDKNPYELASSGCLLMTSQQGCDIVKILENNDIRATIIGRTTVGNDRLIHNEDEIRYLDSPKRDEIYTI